MDWATPFSSEVSNWHVYIHDLEEHPLLHVYAMEEIPYFTIVTWDRSDPLPTKKKAQILPTKFIKPNTAGNPCIEDVSYSRVICASKYSKYLLFTHMFSNYVIFASDGTQGSKR